MKGALTPTRQDGIKYHNTQDPSSPKQLLDSQDAFHSKKANQKHSKNNGHVSQTMQSYTQQLGDSSPQKKEDFVPLTPVVVSQKRKNGNMSLQQRQDKPKMFSSQNVDELKAIDEYKAQISSQIRIQNNQHAAVSARNDITAARSSTQVKGQVNFMGQLSQSPDISNFNSPMEPRDFQANSFHQHQIAIYQTGNKSPENNIQSFLPNIGQKVQLSETQSNMTSQINSSQIRSPSKLIQQLKKTDENWSHDDYGMGKESNDGTQGRAGSRLLMQNGKQNNQVLRTLQQHVTQRQHNNTTVPVAIHTPNTGPGGQYNNQQLLALAQMHQQNAVQQLLNTSANGLKNLRQNFNQSQHIVQSNFSSPQKNSKDHQLEGLNETLQRLAREKAHGKSTMNKKAKSVKPDKTNHKMLYDAYPLQNATMNPGQQNMNLSFIHPQAPMDQTVKSHGKKKSKANRDKGHAPQTLENLKQKMEAQQRSNMMMNESLGAVRLQGVNQRANETLRMTNTQLTAQPQGIDGNIPYAIHNDTRSFINDINQAVTKINQPKNLNQQNQQANQIQIKSKSFDPNSTSKVVYKLNMNQIRLKDSNNPGAGQQSQNAAQNRLNELTPSQLSQYQKNYNYANMAGHIPDELLLPDSPEQMMPVRISMHSEVNKSNELAVNRSIEKNSAPREREQNAYSPTVAATVLQRLQLNTNHQFSSVIEDVEMEQQHSPNPIHYQEERAARLKVDRVRQSTYQDEPKSPRSPQLQGNIKSPRNITEQNSIVSSDLKPQGLKLKLIGMDPNRQPQQRQARNGQHKHSAPEPTEDDDVYTRIVNKINVIIENKKSVEHSREQLKESIDQIKESTQQNQSKSNKRYPKSPKNGQSQHEKYAEQVMLIPDNSHSTHSKRYKSNSRARDDKSDFTKTQQSNNNVSAKKQKTLVIQDIDASPQYQLNTVISPSQTSKASSQSQESLSRIQLQNIELTQQDLEQTNDNQNQNQSQQPEHQTQKKKFHKHQTQLVLSHISNASEDDKQTKRLELPTIESINNMQKGQNGSDNGSQARRYKTQKEDNATGRASQQHITKTRPPKGPNKNMGLLNLKPAKEISQQYPGQNSSRSRKPQIPPKQGQSSPQKAQKLKRGGGQSSMMNNQKNQNMVRQPSVVSIEGYESSETPEAFQGIKLGKKIIREGKTFCQEYIQHRGQQNLPKNVRHLFTPRALKQADGSFCWSQRLFMSKDCALSEERRMLPIMIINLDGAMGFWDDQKRNYYLLRPKIIDGLAQLSYDFRLVAVSSQKKKLINKLIYGLINIPPDFLGHEGSSCSKGIVFDAVYQLSTENEDNKFRSFRKNIDEIHFDLSQVLLDMQFSKHKPEPDVSTQNQGLMTPPAVKEQLQTFWQTDSYRPFKKIIILTTHTYHHKGQCYSYDYNYLFQASKFKFEHSKKTPIIIQLPHLRTQPRVTFESALQLIFTIQSVAYSIACGKQPQQKRFEGEIHYNPDFSSFEICKKFLCSKWRLLDAKMKKTQVVKGLRIFDQKEDPFVDLELIDFSESYKFLKKYYKERKCDWLKLKKHYLMLKPQDKPLSPLKIKQNLKVTFNESPEIRRIGEDRAGSRAVVTTQDSSKSDRITAVKTQFVSEEAKNAYNGLMIRNYKIQQEVNAYARHFRIQNQRKIVMKQKLEQELQAQEEADAPIVIYDGDREKKKSVLRSSFKKSPKKEPEPALPPKKVKEYALKYRVLKIRGGEEPDENSFIDITKYQVINLRSELNYMMNSIRQPGSEKQPGTSTPMSQNHGFSPAEQLNFIQSHTCKEVIESMDTRNFLIELLSKRQTKIQYSTNQEMHLKNNLNQLVDGEQQYKDQQKELNEAEKLGKEAEAEQWRKDKKEQQIDYLDNL